MTKPVLPPRWPKLAEILSASIEAAVASPQIEQEAKDLSAKLTQAMMPVVVEASTGPQPPSNASMILAAYHVFEKLVNAVEASAHQQPQ